MFDKEGERRRVVKTEKDPVRDRERPKREKR
jgi:hypothetical protein